MAESHQLLPDQQGWLPWGVGPPERFNRAVLGSIRVRLEDGDRCRVRIDPHPRLTNINDNYHGGSILGLIDVSLFAACRHLRGVDAARAVTLSLDTQFIAPGNPQQPLDAVVEVLRETGKLCFLRGLVVQDDVLVASFHGSVRKPSKR